MQRSLNASLFTLHFSLINGLLPCAAACFCFPQIAQISAEKQIHFHFSQLTSTSASLFQSAFGYIGDVLISTKISPLRGFNNSSFLPRFRLYLQGF
jgi:hypothetical protein